MFFATALVLGTIGIVVILSQSGPPDATDCEFSVDCADEDGGLGLAIGIFMVGVSNLLAMVSIIGWGVKFGLRAAVADGTLPRG